MPKTQIDRRRRRGQPAQKPADEDSASPEHHESEASLHSDTEERQTIHQETEERDLSSEEEDYEEPDNPDDEDFEAEESPSSDDDDEDFSPEYAPIRKRAAPRRSRTTRRSYCEDKDSSSDEEVRRPPRSRRGRAQQRYQEVDSDEEENHEEVATRRSTPSRASAKRAKEKLYETLGHSDEDDPKMAMISPAKKKKKRKVDSDSDEFIAGQDDVAEEEEDDQLSVEDEDGVLDGNIQNVDNESFCSKDSGSSGDDFDRSPTLNIRRRRQKRHSNTSDDDASLRDFHTTPGQSMKQRQTPFTVSCPSTHDVITMDRLPEKHVCFVTPDHQSRQCFALETLHTVAMTSQLSLQNGKRTFLQPPHFRSPISDDLLDQIASRFGRSALDLDGYFYNRNRKNLPSQSQEDEIDYMVRFGDSLADTEAFRERFAIYVSNLMGHQDVYCCPLCYTEAYRSLTHPDESGDDDSDKDSDADEEDDVSGFVFSQDPMTILGSLDNDSFQLASGFCFTRIAHVKRHLRDDHNVDTSVLDGNGLFTRFKIRESDGLLQRYIDTCHFLAYQGSMSRYWHEGYNLMFLQLLYHMRRTQAIKANPDAVDNADDRMMQDDAEVFLQSFRNRAKRVWEKLSAPYRKMSKKELDDFINDGDDEEEEASSPVFNYAQVREFDMTPEEQVVAALQERRRSQDQAPEEEEEEIESSQEEEDNDSESNYSEGSASAVQESESEEEDEWVQKRRPQSSEKRKIGRGNRTGDKRKPTDTAPASGDTPPTSSTRQKRRIILSDDED